MKVRIKYKKNIHQKEFHDDLTTKFLHMSTGFGGGKTHALIMKLLQLSWLNKPYSGGIMSPTFREYKLDVLPLFEEILEDNKVKYNYNGANHVFTLPWGGKIYAVTGEKKIRGPNWAFAGVNEVTLINIARYREMVGRVRIKNATHPQIASVGTPEGMASDYYEIFVETPWKKSRVIYGNTWDNKENLNEDYIQSMEDSFDSKMLDAYLKGMWINMTGNQFYYSYDPQRNDVQGDEDAYIAQHHATSEVFISLDFNVDPMVATFWYYDGYEVLAFDEIILHDADTNKMAKAIKARGYQPNEVTIYPDPAGRARSTQGQPDIVILRNNGFTDIRVRNVAPRFRQRQLNVNNLLEKQRIKILPKKVPTLKKDLMGVEQDTVSLGKIKKNPKLTHSSDGLDYMCDILFPFSGKRQQTRIVKIR